MGLQWVQEDWLAYDERRKNAIVEDIALSLSQKHPELFSDALTPETRAGVDALIRNAVITRSDLAPHEHEEVVRNILGQASGYGPLEEFFAGPGAEEITEIMINPGRDGPRVFYGKHGRTYPAERRIFRSNEEVTRYCQKICEAAGRPFTADQPIVDAWLKDGSRIAVIGFKASPLGTTATIRKSPLVRPPMPLEKLVENEMLPPFTARWLVDLAVKGHANLAVAGRTDSGKTTFLRALGLHIDPSERVIIGETSFELVLPDLPNCVNIVEVRYGSEKRVGMTDICESILRNNPDRGIVGEIRGGEAVAASEIAESLSGGFWTTLHVGGVDELRSRLPKMFFRGGVPLPREYVDDQIRAMFHFLVFVDKAWDGKRTLMSVVEVTPDGYNTVMRFDTEEFARSRGRVRRWLYTNPVTPETLSRLAFRGATVLPEYEAVEHRYLLREGEKTA